MLVDSHCHLDFPDYEGRHDEVVARARRAGVGTILTIGTELARFPAVHALAMRFADVWCSAGVHPHEAASEGAARRDRLVELARQPKVVALGESGLDYHYDNSPRADQRRNFEAHIEAAVETGLPLVVHTREAEDDTAAMLAGAGGRLRGVLHCFTSSRALAERAIGLGLYVSFSGILTFKGAADLREIAKALPGDRILVETDAPYLAPVPHRGKPNEPALVVHTAAKLAEIRGEDAQDLARATTDNFFRLFAKATPPGPPPETP